MNRKESTKLARYVRALCPQQRFDELTPDAWHHVVGNLDYDDAERAAARVATRQPFVAPAEIVTEVRALRAERLDGFQYEPVPGDDNTAVYRAALRAQRRAAADGHRPAVVQRAITGPAFAELLPADERGLAALDGTRPAGAAPQRRGPLGVVCPKCSAPIGRPCRTPGSRKERGPHSRRRDAATGAALATEQTPEQRLTAARQALAALTPDQLAQIAQEAAQ